MKYLILWFVLCAVFHFVYEGIVAPSLRCKLRYRFFAVRDTLRRAKVSLGDSLTDDAYVLLQELINNAVVRLPRIELMTLWEVYHRLRSDQSFHKAVKERGAQISAILDGCQAREAQQVYDAINKLFDEAFLINSFGWFIYVAPPIAVLMLITKVKRLIIRKVKRLLGHALIAPDMEFDSIAGPPDTATAMPV